MSQVILTTKKKCPFAIEIGEGFVTQKKKGDRGNALKVINHDRSQLSHFQRELVAPLAFG